jgi:integrase
VAPIRDAEDVAAIRNRLLDQGKLREALIFCMGTNNGLRSGDLLGLRVGDVRTLGEGIQKHLREKKTGRSTFFVLNALCFQILQDYLKKNPEYQDSDYLFPSRKGHGRLRTRSLNRMIKEWCEDAGLKGEAYGSQTLRKTFGYIQRTKYGADWKILCQRFGHANPEITKAYLGLAEEEVTEMLMKEI